MKGYRMRSYLWKVFMCIYGNTIYLRLTNLRMHRIGQTSSESIEHPENWSNAPPNGACAYQ